MPRTFLSFAAVCAMLVASTALAQGGGGGRGGTRGLNGLSTLSSMMLVQNADVQKELGLTDNQKTDIQTAMNNLLGNAIGSALQGFLNGGGGGGTDINQTTGDLNKNADEAVAKILKPEQLARLKQLQLQQQGPRALVSADVVAKLKVTDEQKTKIQQIIQASQNNRPQYNNFDPNQTQEERQAAMKAIQDQAAAQQEQTMKTAVAVLSDDQVIQWAELTGKEFKFPSNMAGLGGIMGGMGGRNRGGGGPGGGGGFGPGGGGGFGPGGN